MGQMPRSTERILVQKNIYKWDNIIINVIKYYIIVLI